jgi:hypothetical protein
MVQLNRMTENPEEIPSVDECLRKCDAGVLVPTGGIDVEVRAGWTGKGWRLRTMACVVTTMSRRQGQGQ